MSSAAQKIANQANAQLSTGPKTPAGKAASAANARTHGLCAKELLIAGEDQQEFDRMYVQYHVELHPRGELENGLFDEFAAAAWNLRRVRRMETELCGGHASYTAVLDDEVLQKKLDRLARHHTRIERTFHRCLKELIAIRDRRIHDEACLIAESREWAQVKKRISEQSQSEPISGTNPQPDPPSGPDAAADDEPQGYMTDEETAQMERDFDEIEASIEETRRRLRGEAA